MIDPIKLAKETEKIVAQNSLRKYYRFRKAIYYNGIATADCVGCNLRCVFCWASNVVENYQRIGKFYSPKEVAKKLVEIAIKNNFNKVRISGNEPTISKIHLLNVLKEIPKKFLFILETNGILIGNDKNFAQELSNFKNLHVRVSLKGTNQKEFSKLTGAKPEFFDLQLKALENLKKANVSFHPALIELAKEDLNGLIKKIKAIDQNLKLEIEPLILYPKIERNLKKLNLDF
jgi:uncharacterized Fe-S cluster-containing radical SAM superfamily protein